MKRIALLVLAAALTVALVAGTGLYRMNAFMDSEVAVPEDGTTFIRRPGSSFATVAGELVAQDIIDSDCWYRL